MSRKDTLRALLTARDRKLPDGNPTSISEVDAEIGIDVTKHVRSGAVGAMGRSLGKITHAAEEARALIASGDAVVELDTALIETSFVSDRFGSDPAEHLALVDSIREHGQQVPILVRPHPVKPGRYQAAYGHRRLRALRDLGRPVRAVVRELADADLIVAQGQENSARLDLSYIERALFAMSIEDRGFDRTVVMAALNIEKTQLSRLLSIGRSIPTDIIQAIGSAPKAGRPRWQTIADLIAGGAQIEPLKQLFHEKAFKDLPSDERFARVLNALSARIVARKDREVWAAADGTKILRVTRDAAHTTLVVDERLAPEFGSFLVARMDDLFREFKAQKRD